MAPLGVPIFFAVMLSWAVFVLIVSGTNSAEEHTKPACVKRYRFGAGSITVEWKVPIEPRDTFFGALGPLEGRCHCLHTLLEKNPGCAEGGALAVRPTPKA
jgi:hypothetical protein